MNLRATPGYRYYFWVGFVLILVFALLEPAGTEPAGPAAGVLIWALQVGLLLPLLIWVSISLQAIARFNTLNPWLKLSLSGLLGSIIFVPAALGIDYLFGLDNWSATETPTDIVTIVVEELQVIPLPITLTWIAINIPLLLRLDFSDQNPSADDEVSSPSGSNREDRTFLNLVPREIGTDIVYLKAELHYVRVVAVGGEQLVLYNFGDGVDALEERCPGIRTHRSYWVAASHIYALESKDGRNFIRTDHGHEIPVSRRRKSRIKTFLRELTTP